MDYNTAMSQYKKEAPKQELSQKYKWVALGMLILFLLALLAVTYYWRRSNDQQVVLEQLQESLDTSQNEFLDALDTQLALQSDLYALQDEHEALNKELIRTKIQLGLKDIAGDVEMIEHPDHENLYYFIVPGSTTIWGYDLNRDLSFQDGKEMNILENREVILTGSGDESVKILEIVNDRLIFTQDAEETRNEACYSPWLSENLFYVEPRKSRREQLDYKPPAEKLEEEREKQKQCLIID